MDTWVREVWSEDTLCMDETKEESEKERSVQSSEWMGKHSAEVREDVSEYINTKYEEACATLQRMDVCEVDMAREVVAYEEKHEPVLNVASQDQVDAVRASAVKSERRKCVVWLWNGESPWSVLHHLGFVLSRFCERPHELWTDRAGLPLAWLLWHQWELLASHPSAIVEHVATPLLTMALYPSAMFLWFMEKHRLFKVRSAMRAPFRVWYWYKGELCNSDGWCAMECIPYPKQLEPQWWSKVCVRRLVELSRSMELYVSYAGEQRVPPCVVGELPCVDREDVQTLWQFESVLWQVCEKLHVVMYLSSAHRGSSKMEVRVRRGIVWFYTQYKRQVPSVSLCQQMVWWGCRCSGGADLRRDLLHPDPRWTPDLLTLW